MDPAIRRITPDDWRQFRSLRLAALKEAPFAFVEQYQDAVTRADQHWRERVARHAAGATASIFVAEHRDRLVGKAGCFIEPELTDHVSAQIFGVYVLPPYRGSGTAGALLAATIRWASEAASADRIRLFVADGNDRAAAFYHRIGFVATGTSVPYPPDASLREHELVYAGAPPDRRAA